MGGEGREREEGRRGEEVKRVEEGGEGGGTEDWLIPLAI